MESIPLSHWKDYIWRKITNRWDLCCLDALVKKFCNPELLEANDEITYGGKVLDIVGAIVSGAPFIGGALGALFDTIGALTDNTIEDMKTFQEALNKLSESIDKTK